jgi:uncharacterized protein
MYYLLFYEKGEDHEDRERPLQADHRASVQAAVRRGEIVLGGALADPVDGSQLILFCADSAAVAEKFAACDPYVLGGVVVRWRVRLWETVVGANASAPLA